MPAWSGENTRREQPCSYFNARQVRAGVGAVPGELPSPWLTLRTGSPWTSMDRKVRGPCWRVGPCWAGHTVWPPFPWGKPHVSAPPMALPNPAKRRASQTQGKRVKSHLGSVSPVACVLPVRPFPSHMECLGGGWFAATFFPPSLLVMNEIPGNHSHQQPPKEMQLFSQLPPRGPSVTHVSISQQHVQVRLSSKRRPWLAQRLAAGGAAVGWMVAPKKVCPPGTRERDLPGEKGPCTWS